MMQAIMRNAVSDTLLDIEGLSWAIGFSKSRSEDRYPIQNL